MKQRHFHKIYQKRNKHTDKHAKKKKKPAVLVPKLGPKMSKSLFPHSATLALYRNATQRARERTKMRKRGMGGKDEAEKGERGKI